MHLAQEERIKELSVSIQQIPSFENNNTAIAIAKAVTSDGAFFVDVGDASSESVSDYKFIPYLLRVASTRAKARVLRDAYRIAMTSVEELVTNKSTRSTSEYDSALRMKPTLVSKQGEPATDKQLHVLYSLAKQLDFTPAEIAQLESLSKAKASQKITELSSQVKDRRTELGASSQ